MSRCNSRLLRAVGVCLGLAGAGCFNLESTETQLPAELRGVGGTGAEGGTSAGAGGEAAAGAGGSTGAVGGGGASGSGAGGAGGSSCEGCGPLPCSSVFGECEAELIASEPAVGVAAGDAGVLWLRGLLASAAPVRWLAIGASSPSSIDSGYNFSPRSGALVSLNNAYWGSTNRGAMRAALPATSPTAAVVSGNASIVGLSDTNVVVIEGDQQKNALWRVDPTTGFATTMLCIPPGYYRGGTVDGDGTIWVAIEDTLYRVPSDAAFSAACSVPGSVASVAVGDAVRAVAGEPSRLVLVLGLGSQVVELDRVTQTVTRSFASALETSDGVDVVTPLTAAAGQVYFFNPQPRSGFAQLTAMSDVGGQRSVALVPGTPMALSTTSTHIYIASDAGVYRAPL